MSNEQELEIDITANPENEDINISSEDDQSSEGQDSDESGQEDDTTASTEKKAKKSNKSNFKKLSESKKASDARIRELEAKLAEQDEDDSNEDEDEEESNDAPSYEKVDLLEFLTETEGANKYKEGIKEALEEYPGISFEKALKLAKIDGPEESKSYNNFKTKSTSDIKSKKIKDLTREEATTNLSITQFDIWEKSQVKQNDNPFA